MSELLSAILLAVVGFTTMDYTLGRATVADPLRAILAAVFAVLLVIFVRGV